VLGKKYRRQRKGFSVAPSVVINIVLTKGGAYQLRKFSMLALRELVAYHSKVFLPRKWSLSKDEKTLVLE